MTGSARRITAALVTGVLLVLLTGCGTDSEQEYCDTLAKKQTIFADDGTGQGFLPELADLDELAKKAPDDLRDEWQVFVGAVRDLRTAISDAGVDPKDIVGGKRPEGITEAQWTAIRTAADGLASQVVSDAVSGIDQQAKDVCKLQLGL